MSFIIRDSIAAFDTEFPVMQTRLNGPSRNRVYAELASTLSVPASTLPQEAAKRVVLVHSHHHVGGILIIMSKNTTMLKIHSSQDGKRFLFIKGMTAHSFYDHERKVTVFLSVHACYDRFSHSPFHSFTINCVSINFFNQDLLYHISCCFITPLFREMKRSSTALRSRQNQKWLISLTYGIFSLAAAAKGCDTGCLVSYPLFP